MQENNPVPTKEVVTPVVVVGQPKQSNFLVILLSVLLLFSISIAGFFAYQTQQLAKELQGIRNEKLVNSEPTLEPVATENTEVESTSGWKTYTNKTLGFELKYPSIFTIDKEMNDQYNRATLFKNGNSTFEVMLKDSKYFNRPLDEYYYMDNPDYTKSLLGGENANVYLYDASKSSCVSGNGPSCPVSYVVYVAQNGDNLYHLGFFGDNKLSDLESQILSTFKFIE